MYEEIKVKLEELRLKRKGKGIYKYELDGENYSITELSKASNIDRKTLGQRLKDKRIKVEDALTIRPGEMKISKNKSDKIYEYKGIMYTLYGLAEISGIDKNTLKNRFNSLEMTVEEAVEIPVGDRRLLYYKDRIYNYNNKKCNLIEICDSEKLNIRKLRIKLKQGKKIEIAIRELKDKNFEKENRKAKTHRLKIDLKNKKYNKLTVICFDAETTDKKNNGVIYWLCECECGNKVSLRAYDFKSGLVKSCGCIRIKGNEYKEIDKNTLAVKFSNVEEEFLINKDDWEKVSYLTWMKHKSGYVVSSKKVNEKVVSYKMHRLILGLDDPDIQCDHINRIRTDNRRENLRISDQKRNGKNKSIPINNRSGYLGVAWKQIRKKWECRISINGYNEYLGIYDTIGDALKVRIQAEKIMFEEFAPDHTNDNYPWEEINKSKALLSELKIKRMKNIKNNGINSESIKTLKSNANKTGFIGLTYIKKEKLWFSCIYIKEKNINLIKTENKYLAVKVRLRAEEIYYGRINSYIEEGLLEEIMSTEGDISRDKEELLKLMKEGFNYKEAKNKSRAKINTRNKSGHSGVCYIEKRNTWLASIGIRGKSVMLGYYKEKMDALKVRIQAEKIVYGFIKSIKDEKEIEIIMKRSVEIDKKKENRLVEIKLIEH